MMGFVPSPEYAVHNILVGKPGYSLHENKCSEDNYNID
jgi:hypothetical protein